jgi:hypothetical protein
MSQIFHLNPELIIFVGLVRILVGVGAFQHGRALQGAVNRCERMRSDCKQAGSDFPGFLV